jgi:uncharacterized protein
MELGFQHFAFLFFAALLGGFIDAIAGGGGIVTIPALMIVGMPTTQIALGTNKLQACFGSFTATCRYANKGLMDLRRMKAILFYTAVGAAAGTVTVQAISTEVLKHVIVGLLAILFVYTCFARDFGSEHKPHRIPHGVFAMVFGLGIGFYDGFFGPGTGTLWTVAFVALSGMDLKMATGHTKAVNFASNLVSLAFFAARGQVMVAAGLAMAIGQTLGAIAGSHMVLSRGVRFIRIFFLVVVGLTLARLIYTTYYR